MSNMPTGWLDGWFAHKYGVDVGANPFNEPTQLISHNRWRGGWCARFSACKHGMVLEHDNHEDQY